MNMNIGDIFCDIFDLGILHTAFESAICHEVQKISCDIHAQPGMMIVHGTFIAASVIAVVFEKIVYRSCSFA